MLLLSAAEAKRIFFFFFFLLRLEGINRSDRRNRQTQRSYSRLYFSSPLTRLHLDIRPLFAVVHRPCIIGTHMRLPSALPYPRLRLSVRDRLRTAKLTSLSCYCVSVLQVTNYPPPNTITTNLISIGGHIPNAITPSPASSNLAIVITKGPSTRFCLLFFRVLLTVPVFLSSPFLSLSGLFYPCQISCLVPLSTLNLNLLACPCHLWLFAPNWAHSRFCSWYIYIYLSQTVF